MTDAAFDDLRALLADDPDNAVLLADAAQAAIDAGRAPDAAMLVARRGALGHDDARQHHLAGRVAMLRADWDAAVAAFARLEAEGVTAPGVRCNLAWSLAMAGRRDAALPLLDTALADALPQAAELLLRLLHDAGEVDRALALAPGLLARHPGHRGLHAAAATLAIDGEDIALAHDAAARAGDHPDALAALGTLALDDGRPGAALALFDRALAMRPDAPRARVGRGLAILRGGDAAAAAADLDRGAAAFGNHAGSWIAAGWAHYVAGDVCAARARFDRALALDDRLAEAQGSLAVVDLAAGDRDSARRRAATALRLDRSSFAGALAAALLAQEDGDADALRRIVERAVAAPLDDRGRTIAEALGTSPQGN